MNLESEVMLIMRQSENALTVDQVVEALAERMRIEVRSILNALVKKEQLESVHGGGGYGTHYKAVPIKRLA